MFQLGFLKEKDILLDLNPTDKIDAIHQMVKKLNVRNKEKILKAIFEREKLGTTAIGKGTAIPHARTNLVKKVIVKFALLKDGIDCESLDGESVSSVFLILAPSGESPKYLKILAYVSRIMNGRETREALLNANTKKEILKILQKGYRD